MKNFQTASQECQLWGNTEPSATTACRWGILLPEITISSLKAKLPKQYLLYQSTTAPVWQEMLISEGIELTQAWCWDKHVLPTRSLPYFPTPEAKYAFIPASLGITISRCSWMHLTIRQPHPQLHDEYIGVGSLSAVVTHFYRSVHGSSCLEDQDIFYSAVSEPIFS